MTNKEAIEILKRGYPDETIYAVSEWEDYYDCVVLYDEATEVAIKALETDRWNVIHSEEDLPKEAGFYLVTMEYTDSVSGKLMRITTELFFSTIFQKWSECNSEDSEDGIIAWKPLPKPYKESEAEE